MTKKQRQLIIAKLELNPIYVDLSNCGLTDEDLAKESAIYKALQLCTNTTLLDLSDNQLETLSGFENLTQLKQLHVVRNKIKVIGCLENLTQLKQLYLAYNVIEEIAGLDNLAQLEELYLYQNKIKSLHGIENLKALKRLDVFMNRIESLRGLEGLIQLLQIDVSFNKISRITEIENLVRLEKMNLSYNEITDLTPLISHLKRTENPLRIINSEQSLQKNELNIEHNPFITPPIEVIQQGNIAVLNYFSALEDQGTEYLFEAKMLIVGQPRAGKTSLRCKLFNILAALPEEDKTTRGIDIQRLDFNITDKAGNKRKFFYNVWDFGGQQIYQTTHQFFLTHRSLYVLVTDTGKDSIGSEDNYLNYWLQAVELLGDSPLLLVANEKNDRKLTIDISQKRGRFAFLKNDYGLNLNALVLGTTTYKEEQVKIFDLLKSDIEYQLKKLPLVGFPMPKKWVAIRNELQEVSLTKPSISKDVFIKICETNDVHDYERQMELSQIFHDLGVFLHFQNYDKLDEFIILQNIWATDAVFAVFDNPEITANKGRFTDKEVSVIWKEKNYETAVHKRFLALMMQFELCYQVEKSNYSVYIIPEMLADTIPLDCSWKPNNDLPLQYSYDFMPKGILSKFIVRMHKSISNYDGEQVVWKTGVKIDGDTLFCPNTEAEVTEAWDNKQLDIKAHGPFAKDLLTRISQEIDQLNNEYFRHVSKDESKQRSRWYKMIPCNCARCSDVTDKTFYDYKELIEMKEFGVPAIRCKKRPYLEISISWLLDGFIGNSRSNKRSTDSGITEVKMFVSYSSKDRDLLELLINGLSNHLDNNSKVKYTFWSDKEIDMGGDWKPEIDVALNESDIAILLVSGNFAGSSFIKENELPEFFKRKAESGYLILPVLVRQYNFGEFEKLSSLNFFKTYYRDYGFKKPIERDKLFPFDKLGDNEDADDSQLEVYYSNLADHIHKSVTNHLKNKIIKNPPSSI